MLGSAAAVARRIGVWAVAAGGSGSGSTAAYRRRGYDAAWRRHQKPFRIDRQDMMFSRCNRAFVVI